MICGKNDVASWESKLTYGNQMDGTLKATIKDLLSTHGTLKSTNGKGTADIQTDIKDRKLKFNSAFTIQKPTFDFTSDFFYDHGRDATKKIHFSTLNKIQPNSLESKNVVEVLNERYGFNVDATSEGRFMDGKQHISVQSLLPTGRKLSINADREVKLLDGKGNGKMHTTITDELPNTQQRQLVLDGKLNDIDVKDGFIDWIGSIKYKNYDNKDLKAQLSIKNLKKGHFSTASVQLTTDGSLETRPIDVNVKIDEYCPNHAIYSFDGKYGNIGNVAASGKVYVATKDRPHSHEFSGTLELPNTKLEKLVITSNGQLTEPADPATDSYIAK